MGSIKGYREGDREIYSLWGVRSKILLSSLLRGVRQQRISIRGSARVSVGLSIGPSIGPPVGPSLCPLYFLENSIFRPFSAAAMLRIKPATLRYALRSSYLSLHPSICPSIYLTCLAPMLIHAETQDASLPGQACFIHFPIP